jgi:hypothetical protein
VSDSQNEPGADDLTDELARKYDPDRMLRMVARRAGKGERLDHSLRQKYERRFGVDLSHVRIYSGEFAEEFNRKHNAYAVTVGSTGMVLMGGSTEKAMHTPAGQALLAHELTHVAQAAGGLHRAAAAGGMPSDSEHEHEAEQQQADVEAAGGDPGADTRAANDAAGAAAASKEAMDQAIDQIKNRVHELAADAARSMAWRNGAQRRP